jgi:hypothetical protein
VSLSACIPDANDTYGARNFYGHRIRCSAQLLIIIDFAWKIAFKFGYLFVYSMNIVLEAALAQT